MDSIKLSATLYNGCYGPKSKKGHLINMTISSSYTVSSMSDCKNLSYLSASNIDKHLILCIDESGSMSVCSDTVKASLRTVKSLIGEQYFGTQIKVTLIYFSSHADTSGRKEAATKVWSHYDVCDLTFEQAVESYSPNRGTNINAALELAFEIVNSRHILPTWIFLMTDGEINEGARQTDICLGNYIRDQNNQLVTVSALGYGTDYNIKVLKAIGNYNHIKNNEDMCIKLALCVREIFLAIGMNGRFTVDCISIPGNHQGKMIYGEGAPLVILSGVDISCGYMPIGDILSPHFIKAYKQARCYFSYTDFKGQYVRLSAPIINGGTYPPLSVILQYYRAASGTIIDRILNCRSGMFPYLKREIITNMSEWMVDFPDVSRDEVNEFIKQVKIIKDIVMVDIFTYDHTRDDIYSATDLSCNMKSYRSTPSTSMHHTISLAKKHNLSYFPG